MANLHLLTISYFYSWSPGSFAGSPGSWGQNPGVRQSGLLPGSSEIEPTFTLIQAVHHIHFFVGIELRPPFSCCYGLQGHFLGFRDWPLSLAYGSVHIQNLWHLSDSPCTL